MSTSSGTLFSNEGSSGTSPTSLTTSPTALINLGLSVAMAANAVTVSITDASGGTPTSGSPVEINVRNSPVTLGTWQQKQINSALSLVIPQNATLGQLSAFPENTYVYYVFDGSTQAIAVSTSRIWDEGTLYDTTAIAGGTSRVALYTSTAMFGCSVRFIGRFTSTQATAGTWVTAASAVAVNINDVPIANPTVYVLGAPSSTAGHGLARIVNRCFSIIVQTGNSLGVFSVTQSATLGTAIIPTRAGLYQFWYNDSTAVNGGTFGPCLGITKNDPDGNTAPQSFTSSQAASYLLAIGHGGGLNTTEKTGEVTAVVYCNAGDVIQALDGTSTNDQTSAATVAFRAVAINSGYR